MVQMKATSNERQAQNIKSGTSQQLFIGSYSIFKLRLRQPRYSFQLLEIKMASDGRLPQNIISGISQKQLNGSFSNSKHKLR